MKIKLLTAVTLSAALTLTQTAFANTCNVSSYVYIGAVTEDGVEEIYSSGNASDIFNNYLPSCAPSEWETAAPSKPEPPQTEAPKPDLKPIDTTAAVIEPTTEETTKYTEPSTEVTTKYIEPTTEATTKYIEPTTEATTKYIEPTTEATTKYVEPTTEATTKYVEPTTETTTKYIEPTTEATTAAAPSTGSAATNTLVANQILSLVNSERAAAGLSPLTLSSNLNYAATLKAQDMADNNYFSHTSPTYGTPFQMLQTLGISYRAAGENIAKGQKTAEAVMTAWMNSEGHRANILSSSYGKLGVGYVNQNGTTYWVQIFTD